MARLTWGSVLVAVVGAFLLLAWPSGPGAPRTNPTSAVVSATEPAPSRPIPERAPWRAGDDASAPSGAAAQRELREQVRSSVEQQHRAEAARLREARAERREARRRERLERRREDRAGHGDRSRPAEEVVVPVDDAADDDVR